MSMASLKEKMGVPKPLAASIIAWAIKAPDGMILWKTLEDSFHDCIFKYTHKDIGVWNRLADEGYRCVRVTVQEMQE